jgi:DNA-binding FrmR family transcriptional regulator
MHLLAACRGAVGSLTAEVLEGHVRSHIVDPDGSTKRAQAAADLIEVLRTYVR